MNKGSMYTSIPCSRNYHGSTCRGDNFFQDNNPSLNHVQKRHAEASDTMLSTDSAQPVNRHHCQITYLDFKMLLPTRLNIY
jgi:hypothetical protein